MSRLCTIGLSILPGYRASSRTLGAERRVCSTSSVAKKNLPGGHNTATSSDGHNNWCDDSSNSGASFQRTGCQIQGTCSACGTPHQLHQRSGSTPGWPRKPPQSVRILHRDPARKQFRVRSDELYHHLATIRNSREGRLTEMIAHGTLLWWSRHSQGQYEVTAGFVSVAFHKPQLL